MIYLNVLIPITLSFQQVFLLALEVVKIGNDKGIDLATISPHQLDRLIALSISTVKQVFR